MKGMGTVRKLAIAVAVCMAVLCLPGYSEPTPEQIAERTKLLFEAVKNDDVEWVKLLINHGAYVNARVGNSETILMYAISKDVADVLIKSGADVNAKDNQGKTALMHAAYGNRADVTELLIKSGANVKAKDNLGKTALMYARDTGSRRKDDIAILLRAAGQRSKSKRPDIGENTYFWRKL